MLHNGSSKVDSQTIQITNHLTLYAIHVRLYVADIVNNWVLSTNHRRIAIMYFMFIVVTSFSGLILATVIRIELAHAGISFFNNNSEKYLTVAAVHAFVMVFFVIVPLLYGAFGNFLLPTQLGVRDVAFPRLNSFMFWITPSGFILLLHIFFMDKNPSSVYKYTLEDSNCNDVWYSDLAFIYDSFNIDLLPHEVRQMPYEDKPLIRGKLLPIFYYFLSLSKNEKITYTPDYSWLDELTNANSDFNKRTFRLSDTTRSTLEGNISEELYSAVDNFTDFKKSFLVKVSSWASNQIIAGWALITPYSSRLKYSAVGKIDIALIVVFVAGMGSIFSSVNYVLTYRCISSPSFKNRKELRSFFVDGLMVGSRMIIAANPALLIAIVLLLSDRHLGTSIFDFSGGGDAVLFQHLFWFFGHPEVYIIIIPCFGIINSIMPHLLRKRLSGRLSLQFSMYTIAFMSFAVWGHHMYMVGLANTTRTLYSTMTVMISVPASTKVLHWCVTLLNSAPQFDVSLLFILSFTYFFTLGGLSGMFNAHIGFDVALHDTFFVIGHFHVMLAGGAFSAGFAAFYFYFSSIFGVKYSKYFGILHFLFYFFGQLLTVIPMIWMGYSGMPRRIMDYPAFFNGWHSIVSGGHLLSVLGYFFFICMIIDSLYVAKSPTSRTYGISRVGNRFAFYEYSRSKLLITGKHATNNTLKRPNILLKKNLNNLSYFTI